jgi:hypothetical protein
MSVFRVAFPALSCLSLLASPALAENCWYPHEAKAAQLRDFQTMLMVGTLQCKGVSQSSIELYNGFVSKQRGSLDANNYILKARFMRESGIEGGRVAYDEYVTGLANAQAAKLGDPSFCPTVETFVRLAADAAQPDLLKLAEAVIDPPQSGQCPPSNYYAGTGGPQVKAAVAVEEPAAPANVEVAATTPAPAAAPAPAAPAPTQAEALQAAIVALQSATAALQAANAPAAAAAPTPVKAESSGGNPKVIHVADAPVVPPEEPKAE